MRLSERCGIAPTFPITIVVAARKASAGPQSSCDRPSAWSNSRRKTANAAALVATAMKVVIGVGAPWYTSGVHWWKGATDALKASPAAASPMPVRSSGSAAFTLSPAIAKAIPSNRIAPVAPYISASPYRSVADPTEPTTRYLSPASSEVRRCRWVAHST